MPNPKGGINPQAIDADDAYNKIQFRAQDTAKDREDPQVGPVENRSRTIDRSQVGAYKTPRT